MAHAVRRTALANLASTAPLLATFLGSGYFDRGSSYAAPTPDPRHALERIEVTTPRETTTTYDSGPRN